MICVTKEFGLVLLLACLHMRIADADATGWPVSPNFTDRPLGASLGELRHTQTDPPAAYQHTGIDILVSPWRDGADDASAPWVTVTVPGVIDFDEDEDEAANPAPNYIEAAIVTPDGRRYRYLHLAEQSFSPQFIDARNNYEEVAAGTPIARVTPWKAGDCANAYHHLHYDIRAGDKYLNPLTDIGSEADPDAVAPHIVGVGFSRKRRQDGSWSEFQSRGQTCTKVKGEIDIVAHVLDLDNAGSSLPGASNIGVYNLRWRACPADDTDCDNWSTPHSYPEMDVALENPLGNSVSRSRFSMSEPWKSRFDECSPQPDKTFVIVTGPPSKPWDTSVEDDGDYIVTIEARDLAGQVEVHESCVRVQN